MSTLGRFWQIGLVCAIAMGCSTTTANSGGTVDATSDSGQDSGLTDTAQNDIGGCVDDGFGGCSGLDGDGKDATGPSDAISGTDATGGTDATSADTGSSTCPPALKDKTLGQHAKTCTQDSDCAYGLCQKGGFLTGYDDAIGYCTKDCGCSDPASQCSKDNAGGKEFICGFELSKSGGNPKAGATPQKRCSLHCLTDADCAAWNSNMPHCINSTNYVSSAGVCGFDPLK